MKNLFIITCVLFFVLQKAAAQDIAKAGQQTCDCLKDLDPEKLSHREVSLGMIGCLSRQVDVIAEELKKKNAWVDSLALTYMSKVSNDARARCPEQFEKLKKKETVIDPSLLAIKPDAPLISGYSQAVCNCLGVSKDLDNCMQRVGTANEAEIKKRFPGDEAMSAMMGLAMDVMFDLADHCDAAGFNATIAKLKTFPAIKDGCKALVMGEFSSPSMLGETRSTFTANKLSEFKDGKLSTEYSLTWSGCTMTITCTVSNSEMTKKGSVSTLEVRRASADGFIAFTNFGKMKVPVFYNRVK